MGDAHDEDAFVSNEDTVTCPECGGGVTIDHSASHTFVCPHCGAAFDPDADETSGETYQQRERRKQQELDTVRIRQLSTERRAIYRQRSYVIVFAGACLVGAIQLGWMAYQHVRDIGLGAKPAGYILFAIAGIVGAVMLWKKASRMTVGMNARNRGFSPVMPGETSPPPTEPDFSTLGDGRDRWEKLNEVK
jgi:ribosomal protein L37AE/L43A